MATVLPPMDHPWRLVARVWIGASVVALLVLAMLVSRATGDRTVFDPPKALSIAVPPVLPRAAPSAAPAAGVTGTMPLPALPIGADAAAAIVAGQPQGIVAARPFSMRGLPGADQGRALQCLADAIYYEAASEPTPGQAAVAQVILNRVRHPAFPATVCGVVYQGSEHAGCQFSFACDGATARAPARASWLRASRVAAMALAGYVYAPVGLATHYHTYAVTPAWNRSLVMTDAVGAHFFHRWKGYWGTPAAFTQRYAGGEPIPGPHAASIETSINPPTYPAWHGPTADVLPLHIDSGRPLVAAPADNLPPAPEVLDRWKDSGKPLR